MDVELEGAEYLLLLDVDGCNCFLSALVVLSLLALRSIDLDIDLDLSELLDNDLLERPLENPTARRDSSVLSRSMILPASSCLTLLSSTDKDGVDRNSM